MALELWNRALVRRAPVRSAMRGSRAYGLVQCVPAACPELNRPALLCAGRNQRMSLPASNLREMARRERSVTQASHFTRDIVFVSTHFYRSVGSVFDEVQDYDERQ